MANGGDSGVELRMTVAAIHESGEHATLRFLESARIYRLPKTTQAYASVLRDLKSAAAARRPVCVRLAGPENDIIIAVREDC